VRVERRKEGRERGRCIAGVVPQCAVEVERMCPSIPGLFFVVV